MRRKLIAGNWKMNTSYKEAEKLSKDIISSISKSVLDKVDVLLCPPFISIGIVSKTIKGSGLKLGAQNVYFENNGAFTGEISAEMLVSAGCEYVIIGHSERRKLLHETDKMINKKIHKVLEAGLIPVLCIGESLEEREDEIFEGVIEKQLTDALQNISKQEMEKVVIAYEPVWAIGTGLNAAPEQISAMHRFISEVVEKLYDSEITENMLILYGGSVNEKNSKEILSACGVDGALVGGASLKAAAFCSIAKDASEIKVT
ncbi:MAG: Bifunctional PGK/TIM [Ignavibacteria bacterium]|nr:Bifunctional PGK/TIM [Ignavibacteria bacterium]